MTYISPFWCMERNGQMQPKVEPTRCRCDLHILAGMLLRGCLRALQPIIRQSELETDDSCSHVHDGQQLLRDGPKLS